MDVIKNIYIYIKGNIGWIKDIFTIILTLSATVISYFTYKKAKKSLLQPMKSEVIHIQTNMMIDLINYISDEFDNKILDIYQDLISINLYKTLIDCGYVNDDLEKTKQFIKEKSVGAILIPDKDGRVKSLEIISAFEKKSEICYEDIKKEIHEDLQNDTLHIDMIHITKEYSECMKNIIKYRNNPLMPQKIADILGELLNTIENNVKEILNKAVENSVIEFNKLQGESKGRKIISSSGVYNEFIVNRIEHEPLVRKIRKEIREFLRVDEEW